VIKLLINIAKIHNELFKLNIEEKIEPITNQSTYWIKKIEMFNKFLTYYNYYRGYSVVSFFMHLN